jgi:hypothetical protein
MPSKTAPNVAAALNIVGKMTPEETEILLERMALEARVPITIRHPDLPIPGVTIRLEYWGRKQAEEALAANKTNRSQRDRRALGYYRDMVGSQFPFAGDSVCFDWDGNFFDGQHRMEALRRAAAAAEKAGLNPDLAGIWVIVVRGLPPETREHKDRGIPRRASDDLQMGGYENAAAAATLARMIITLQRQARPSLPGVSTIQPTDPEVTQVVREHAQEITECVTAARAAIRRAKELALIPRAVQYALWNFRSADTATADGWLEWLTSGAGMDVGHPVMVLRKTLLNPRLRKLSALDQVDLFFQSWNALQNGETDPQYDLPPRAVKASELTEPVYVRPPVVTAPDDIEVPPVVFAAAAAG